MLTPVTMYTTEKVKFAAALEKMRLATLYNIDYQSGLSMNKKCCVGEELVRYLHMVTIPCTVGYPLAPRTLPGLQNLLYFRGVQHGTNFNHRRVSRIVGGVMHISS